MMTKTVAATLLLLAAAGFVLEIMPEPAAPAACADCK
jgi:hypothetical protein